MHVREGPLVILVRRPKLRSKSPRSRSKHKPYPIIYMIFESVFPPTHTHTRTNDSTGLFGLSFQAFIDGNGERDNGKKVRITG